MKSLETILHKKYYKPLAKQKEFKLKWKQICKHLITCGYKIEHEDDASVLRYELLEQSIQVKEKLEEVFFDTYVHMYDYWNDLTYQERKRQVNIDQQFMIHDFPYFMYEDQKIYMPSFSKQFNHLYTDEIVLLDLKQYHVYIREYDKIEWVQTYHHLPFEYGFSSARLVAKKDTQYVLYHECAHRFYLYEGNKQLHTYSCSLKKEMDEAKQERIAQAILSHDEDELIQAILQCDVVEQDVYKKLIKLQNKRNKNKKT